MRVEAANYTSSVSQALTKGAYPIYAILKDFQTLPGPRQQFKDGVPAGGGLLGRVAEFLVGQRGL